MAIDQTLAPATKIPRRDGGTTRMDANFSLDVPRPVIKVSRCATGREWKGLTDDQKRQWVRATIECDDEGAYIDLINALVRKS